MGTKTQYECDSCGLQVVMVYYFPDGWRYVRIQRREGVGNYFDEDYWLLCTNCIKTLRKILPDIKCNIPF